MNFLRGWISGLGIFLTTVMLLALTGCSNLDYLNFTVSNRGYWRTNDLAFGKDARQKLDVYVPTKVPANGKVIVFIYGGSWRIGSKSDYRFVGQALTSRGFTVVIPDYRLHPQVIFPAFVEDSAAAVRWTWDNIASYGGDTNQIYLLGHSAGAHMAAMLTLDERYLNAVGLDNSIVRATAAISGPYDSSLAPENRPVFGLSTNDPALPPDGKPITFVGGKEPPMLLAHGLQDDIVPPGNAERLAQRIREAGGQVEVIYYPKRGHGGMIIAMAWPNQWLAPILEDVTDYFKRH